jgi:Flp pilus assembly protein TadD
MFEAAVQFIKSSQFQKAEEVLLDIIYKQPRDFDANHMLGVVYGELGKTELAEKHLKLTSSIDPNHPPLYQNWGLFLSKQRRFEEAIDKFNVALRLAPNFPQVYSYIQGQWVRPLLITSSAIRRFSLSPTQPLIRSGWFSYLTVTNRMIASDKFPRKRSRDKRRDYRIANLSFVVSTTASKYRLRCLVAGCIS